MSTTTLYKGRRYKVAHHYQILQRYITYRRHLASGTPFLLHKRDPHIDTKENYKHQKAAPKNTIYASDSWHPGQLSSNTKETCMLIQRDLQTHKREPPPEKKRPKQDYTIYANKTWHPGQLSPYTKETYTFRQLTNRYTKETHPKTGPKTTTLYKICL